MRTSHERSTSGTSRLGIQTRDLPRRLASTAARGVLAVVGLAVACAGVGRGLADGRGTAPSAGAPGDASDLLTKANRWPQVDLSLSKGQKGPRRLEDVLAQLNEGREAWPFSGKLNMPGRGVEVTLTRTSGPFWEILGETCVAAKVGFARPGTADGSLSYDIGLTDEWRLLPGFRVVGPVLVGLVQYVGRPQAAVPGAQLGRGPSPGDRAVVVIGHPHEIRVLVPPKVTWAGREPTALAATRRSEQREPVFLLPDPMASPPDPAGATLTGQVVLAVTYGVHDVKIPRKDGVYAIGTAGRTAATTWKTDPKDGDLEATVVMEWQAGLRGDDLQEYRRALQRWDDDEAKWQAVLKLSDRLIDYTAFAFAGEAEQKDIVSPRQAGFTKSPGKLEVTGRWEARDAIAGLRFRVGQTKVLTLDFSLDLPTADRQAPKPKE